MATINTKKLQVTELDFDEIKSSLIEFLRGYSKDGVSFSDYDFEGSGLAIIMDLLAYNTHYNAYYTNMIANEMFLDTATLRASAVSIAKHLGYTPRSVVSARALVDIKFDATDLTGSDAGTEVPIPKGSVFSTTIDGKTYGFVTVQSWTAAPETSGSTTYVAEDVEIVEGVFASVQYAFNSRIEQKFIIPSSSVDTSTISILVTDSLAGTAGTLYTLAEDFTTLDSESNVFFLQETADGLYEIYFGDGNVGRSPVDGNVIDISYVVSNGDAVNGTSTFVSDPIASPKTSGTTYAAVATITQAAAGGAARETLESIKFLAPRNYEAQNRAVTVDDYKVRIMSDFAQVDAVTCWGGEDNDPPQYGKVYVSIKPKTGYVLTDTEKDSIKKNILKTRNVLTVEPILVDPDYLYLVLDGSIKWDSRLTTLTAATLKAGIQAEIVSFGQANLEKFETYFRYSSLLRTIDNYDPGVLNSLIDVKIRKEINPTLQTVEKYELNFANPIYRPHSGHIGAVTSSSFTYQGFTACELSDKDGVLQINGVSSSGQNILLDSAAGTVDYDTGKIVLSNFAPQAVSGSALQIDIVPAKNDIVPAVNQLITIRDADVSLSMSDDSSVLEGTIYTTTRSS